MRSRCTIKRSFAYTVAEQCALTVVVNLTNRLLVDKLVLCVGEVRWRGVGEAKIKLFKR